MILDGASSSESSDSDMVGEEYGLVGWSRKMRGRGRLVSVDESEEKREHYIGMSCFLWCNNYSAWLSVLHCN
jgi:hypothetical protein